MSRIEGLEQFKLVKGSNIGFIVFSDDTAKTIHQSKCDVITENKFASSGGSGFHWFSTVEMARKSFSIVMCDACKPDA
jgi:hypothetical protein